MMFLAPQATFSGGGAGTSLGFFVVVVVTWGLAAVVGGLQLGYVVLVGQVV